MLSGRRSVREERKSWRCSEAAAARQGDRVASLRRESIPELVSKKRDIFLVQLGLDVKASEIAKLQDLASKRAASLVKAEKLLEADSKRFEDFLQSNAAKLSKAFAKVEAERRAKTEKVAEIKRWEGAIAGMRSELSRSEEQLEDAKRLQKFLEELTPPEWREGLVQERDARHSDRMAVWQAECEANRTRQDDARAAQAAASEAYESARTQQAADRAQADMNAASAALAAAQLVKDPEPPELEELDEHISYFQEPEQLLEVLDGLEEQNLALVQSTQEMRAALEDAQAKHKAMTVRLDAECKSLHAQIRRLEADKEEQLHGLRLSKRGSEEAAWYELSKIVGDAYTECGFLPNTAAGPVEMLTAVELRFEECLRAAAALPPTDVEEGERAREKGRRQAAREAKKKRESEEYKARMEKAEARASAPIFKRTCKPEMTRSYLPKARSAADEGAATVADDALRHYIDRDFP